MDETLSRVRHFHGMGRAGNDARIRSTAGFGHGMERRRARAFVSARRHRGLSTAFRRSPDVAHERPDTRWPTNARPTPCHLRVNRPGRAKK